MTGHTALVTGANHGIGAATCLALAQRGCAVLATYLRGQDPAGPGTADDDLAWRGKDAAGVVAAIEAAGGRAVAVEANLADPDAAGRLFDAAEEQLGPVDILVNNAGINRDRSVRKMSAAEWDEVIQTNLDAVFHCSKAVLEPMIARGWGRIINIASIIGQTGAFGQANYAAAKAGVIAFTKSVAQEVAKFGVTVNAICPGFVDTEMVASMPQAAKEAVKGRIPLGRFGDADEVARLVRFLCTEGDWITGAQLNINGGQFM